MTDSIYIQAEMQGYIEKKGIWRNTKYHATVQGSTLYLEKGGVMNLVELSDAHQVRKVPDDPSGLQLEICLQKKKSMIFICPGSEDCDAWVRALRDAMVHKDTLDRKQRRGSSSQFFVPPADDEEEEIDVYATIQDNDVKVRPESVLPKKQNGSIIATQTASPQDEADSIYHDAISSTENSQNNEDKKKTTTQNLHVCDYANEDTVVEHVSLRKPSFTVPDSNCNLSTTTRENDTSDETYTDAVSLKMEHTSGQDLSVQDSYSKNVNSGTFSSYTEHPSIDEKCSGDDTVNEDVDVKDLLDILSGALSVCDDEATELNHYLQNEDFLPLRQLTEFLSNNKTVCRASVISDYVEETDPVTSLKQYLCAINAMF